jgi:hypothetical protein
MRKNEVVDSEAEDSSYKSSVISAKKKKSLSKSLNSQPTSSSPSKASILTLNYADKVENEMESTISDLLAINGDSGTGSAETENSNNTHLLNENEVVNNDSEIKMEEDVKDIPNNSSLSLLESEAAVASASQTQDADGQELESTMEDSIDVKKKQFRHQNRSHNGKFQSKKKLQNESESKHVSKVLNEEQSCTGSSTNGDRNTRSATPQLKVRNINPKTSLNEMLRRVKQLLLFVEKMELELKTEQRGHLVSSMAPSLLVQSSALSSKAEEEILKMTFPALEIPERFTCTKSTPVTSSSPLILISNTRGSASSFYTLNPSLNAETETSPSTLTAYDKETSFQHEDNNDASKSIGLTKFIPTPPLSSASTCSSFDYCQNTEPNMLEPKPKDDPIWNVDNLSSFDMLMRLKAKLSSFLETFSK